MAKFLGINLPTFNKRKANQSDSPSTLQSHPLPLSPPSLPTKVYIERTDDPNETMYSTMSPAQLNLFYDLMHGRHAGENFLSLFYCLPEVFAPVHEIASRVADANWQLVKEWNDEVDYNDADFNKLFTAPNPLQDHKTFVYMSVVYEICTGGQFWYTYRDREYLVTPEGEEYKNILGWWNLAAHTVCAVLAKIDPYTAIKISDLVQRWEEADYIMGGKRVFDPADIDCVLNLSLDRPFDLNCRVSHLLGAEKAIRNLIPVYEARGVIYIKRGALGFVVSQKSDESGLQALSPKEKKQAREDFQETYGLTQDKSPISITALPVKFERTAMSIQELEPFNETLADACAIYAVLRVPPHLIPSKDKSTFNNANTDMKSFYTSVIIPWAKKYAQIWTTALSIPRRYINPDFNHVDCLQEDKKLMAEYAQVMGNVWKQRWMSGVCSLNEWIAAVDGNVVKNNPVFDKKISEMDEKELTIVKGFLSLTAKNTDEKKNKTEKPKNEK